MSSMRPLSSLVPFVEGDYYVGDDGDDDCDDDDDGDGDDDDDGDGDDDDDGDGEYALCFLCIFELS